MARCLRGALPVAMTLLAAPWAAAQPPADTASIVTLSDENASITPNRLSDRNYVNGLRLGYTSGTDQVPGFLGQIGRVVWGDGQQRISFDLSQQIYTPANTQLAVPDPRDRPYAGVLLANFSLLTDKDNSRSVLGLSLGIVGPGAGGEQIQNGFHDIIGQGHDAGWSHQIPDTFAFEALAERTWRYPLAHFGGLETDVLPAATVGVGDLRDYVQLGATFRIGQGLGSDFGVSRVRPGLSGSDAFTPVRPFAWYVFAGVDGQAVGYDLLLERGPFRGGPHVDPVRDVGEAQFGAAVMAYGARLTYTQIVQTQEFRHQHGGLHQLGALTLSVRF